MKTRSTMDAAAYDAWYETSRGRWIGGRETALILDALQPQAGESLLDVGCGTGHFTRALASAVSGPIVGVDISADWLAHARARGGARISYHLADAQALPYADGSFDLAMSITALCFVDDERRALRELLRVTRRRFVLGLLNRHSLLWRQKGRDGGVGAYRGARWHTATDARRLFEDLPATRLVVRSAIQLPGGGWMARTLEHLVPAAWTLGGFLLVAGDVKGGAGDARGTI